MMSRFVFGSLILILCGGTMPIIGHAQDVSRYGSGVSQLAQPRFELPSHNKDNPQNAFLLVSEDNESSGQLQSVLKRFRDQEGESLLPEGTSTVATSEPRVLEPSGTESPAARVASSTSALTHVSSDPQVSSRRTHSLPAEPAEPAATTATPAAPTTPEPLLSTLPSENAPPATSLLQNRDSAPTTTPLPTRSLNVASRPISSRRAAGAVSQGDSQEVGVISSSAGAFLQVETRGPKSVLVGETSVFLIVLSNAGTNTARDVSLQIAVPESLQIASVEANDGSAQVEADQMAGRHLVWSLDQVAGRAEKRLQLSVVPQSNQPFDLGVTLAVQPISSTASIEVQEPQLEIAVRGPGEVIFGETHVYSVVVSNPGTGDAKNVALSMALGSENADTLQIGTLPAGGSKRFDVEVTARDVGEMQIVAQAIGANQLKSEAVEQIVVKRANLRLDAVGSTHKYAGSIGTYQVRVANIGNASASGVQASVRLPHGVKYLKGIEGAQQNGDLLSWNIGQLEPGGEQTNRFYCELTVDGDMHLQFAAQDSGSLTASGQVSTRVEAIADLSLSLNDPRGPIPVGEEVTYEIEIVNRGSKAAEEVQVLAQFSEGIEPISADGARAEVVPGQVVFQPIARIAPKGTTKLVVKARAEQDGNHICRVVVECSSPETKLSAQDTTRFFGEEELAMPGGFGDDDFSESFEETPRLGSEPSFYDSTTN